MITSDYLEQIVDFDKPILAIGPGIRRVDPEWGPKCYMPMDIALIWFAEHLSGRKGRLDVFDFPAHSTAEGGDNDIAQVEQYLRDLGTRVALGEMRFITGDLRTYSFPREYGFVWSHGTLDWIVIEDRPDVFKNTSDCLLSGGITAHAWSYPSPFKEWSKPIKEIALEKDAYKTSVRREQLHSGRINHELIFKDGLLIPLYSMKNITVVRL